MYFSCINKKHGGQLSCGMTLLVSVVFDAFLIIVRASKRRKAPKASAQLFACSHCGETFKYRSVLIRHENQKHRRQENEPAAEQMPNITTKGEFQ
jgi:uncharacterized C2H2 Zn-finger protein